MSAPDIGKGDGPHKMRDSGLGSLGSESDTSPSQANKLTAVNIPPVPISPTQAVLAAVDVMTGTMQNASKRKFPVTYVGYSVLDRRYTLPQFWKSFIPWLVAEVKRKPNPHSVILQVHDNGSYTLNGYSADAEKLLFEHKLQHLSKFSRIHRDTKCFVYLTKGKADEYVCHVYQAPTEVMVVELFECIREATKHAISDPTQTTVNVECSAEYARMTPASLFEIMYIGKMPVIAKKAAPTFIDETVEKFLKYEEKKVKEVEEEERKRHASGTSVRSLPMNLDQTVTIDENDLVNQVESPSNESNASSGSGSGDGLSGSSSENVLNNNSSDQHDGLAKSDADNLQRMALYNHGKKNRTMLLQITANEVCLINTDRKKVIMKRNFRDISFCSQGIHHPHHFGFITKELDSNAFLCYVFMCATEQVVKEVMQTLKQAFLAAYQQSSKKHTCEMCPMHQLHRLCEDIHKLEADVAYELIMKRIMQLCDQDQVDIMTSFQTVSPFQAESVESHQEMNEALISILRHMCEQKQQDHTHISDTANKNPVLAAATTTKHSSSSSSVNAEFNLSGSVGKSNIAHKLGDFRTKARKSLTHSFESLKKDSSMEDCTPVSSPLSRDAGPHSALFPSSLVSPTEVSGVLLRKRSSSESHAEERRAEMLAIEEDEETAAAAARGSPVLHEVPRRHIFNRANNSSCSMSPPTASRAYPRTPCTQSTPDSTGGGGSGGSSPHPALTRARTAPRRRHSWRLNILNKVVTPARHVPSSLADPEDDDDPLPLHLQDHSSTPVKPAQALDSQAIRQLWKKAILETLLLIRMQKEKTSLKAHPDEDEAAVRALKLDYEEMTPCLKEVTKVWESMLSNPARSITTFPWDQLNSALKDGVPRSRRGDIWQLVVEQHKLHKASSQHMEHNKHLQYQDLLKMLTTHQHAILIDLGRTFPGHPYFATQLGSGQLSLFNLLKAYSLLDKEVGYCQGLSFVAGILLMHMPEEKAFETMEFLMFNLGFRRQYRPDMVALQIQLYQLSRLLHDYYRDLYEHFELHDIAPTMYAAAWFLTLFASQFPLGFVARVFDLLFLQGMDVVFKVGLVLLGNHKELIKQCTSFESVMEFLKTTLPGMGIIQMERIINQVFALDISKQLQAYEVEYHVLQEEMVSTPQRSEVDVLSKLEAANHNLKRQNLELLEKLQGSHSQVCSLKDQVHGLQTSTEKLKTHVRTLELERLALLNAVEGLKVFVPVEARLGLEIPEMKANVTLTGEPIHNPLVNPRFLEENAGITLKSNSLTEELNDEVEQLMIRRKSAEEEGRRNQDGRLAVSIEHRPRSSNM